MQLLLATNDEDKNNKEKAEGGGGRKGEETANPQRQVIPITNPARGKYVCINFSIAVYKGRKLTALNWTLAGEIDVEQKAN